MKLCKRLLCVLLCLVLLLSACAKPADNADIPREATRNKDFSLAESLEGLSVFAEQGDAFGIETTTSFVVRSPGKPSEQLLQETLSLQPGMACDLKRIDGETARLIPEEELQPDKVYTVQARTPSGEVAQSWAFQTKRRFAVLSTTPSRDAGYVERNSGIEFAFSYENIDIEPHFSISPGIPGRFMQSGNRSVFVPDRLLAPNTTYTVTLSGDVKAPDGKALGKDYVFSFKSSDSIPYELAEKAADFYLRGEVQETFFTEDTPVLELTSYNIARGQQYAVAVYPLTGTEYLAELRAHNRRYYDENAPEEEYLTDLSQRAPLFTFDAAVTPMVDIRTGAKLYDGWYERYLLFPEPLAAGHYIAQVSVPDAKNNRTITRQKLLQVSDASVYLQSVNGDNLLWLNDAATGRPVAGANVTLLRAGEEQQIAAAATGEDGTASLATGEDKLAVLHIPWEDGGDYWDMVWLGERAPPTARELYTAFAYTDRLLYKPTDRVQFWGVVRGRQQQLPAGTALTMQLREGYGYSWEYEPEEAEHLLSAPVALEADGTFIGHLDISSLKSNYYHLALVDGEGRTLKTIRFEVELYEKPEYEFKAYSDKVFYLPGEEMDVNVQVNFFEGTPVWGMKLAAFDNYGHLSAELTTGAGGHARTSFAPGFSGDWHPRRVYYTVYSRAAERYEDVFGGGAIYFPSDMIVRAEQGGTPEAPAVTVRTNALDLSRIETAEDIYEDYPHSFIGRPVDAPVEVTVEKIEYRKTLTGSYYDWTSKKTVNHFRYEELRTVFKQYSIATRDGEVSLPDLPAPSRYISYQVNVSVRDSLGQYSGGSVYICASRFRWYSDLVSNIKNYSFQTQDTQEQYYNISDNFYWSPRYKLGQRIGLTLGCNERPVEEMTGRALYTAVQDKILSSAVTDKAELSFTQSAELLPNFTVAGAYFDGRYVFPVSGPMISYDPAEEELAVSIEAEGERYRPGEEVKLRVQVRDRDQKGVRARVSLSVVDEAMFALGEQYLTPAAELYEPCYYRPVSVYASYTQHRFYVEESGGKGGGGGDAPVRSNFPDTAQFLAVSTDENGAASASFTLPDSVTRWRVTGVAVEEAALRAGVSTLGVDASLPLFLQVLYNETYLTGDDVGLSVRAYGTATGQSTPVRYRAEVKSETDESFLRELESKGRSNVSCNINFGKLPAGDYTLTVRGRTNSESDAVAYSFSVVPSALELPVVRSVILDENGLSLEPAPARYPVLIGFADAQYGSYFEAAQQLLQGYGGRADRRVAAIAAKRSMLRFVEEKDRWFLDGISEDISGFLVQDQRFWRTGVALHAYDTPDPELTAKTLALLGGEAAGAGDMEEMKGYLRFIIENPGPGEGWEDLHTTPAQRAAAMTGLAALGEPVLLEIRERLKTPALLENAEKLYLCAALALLGDQAGAKAVFDGEILPAMQWAGEYLRFPAQGEDEGMRLSSLALFAAAAMGHEHTEAIARSLLAGSSTFYDPSLELAMYVRQFRPVHTGAAEVQYKKNGKIQRLALGQRAVRYLSFMEEDLAGGDLRATRGSVAATLYYTGTSADYVSPGTLGQSGEQLVGITREARPASAMDAVKFRMDAAESLGGLYTVKLTLTFAAGAPLGIYELSERIPSPLRFNSYEYDNVGAQRTSSGVWMERERQNLRFTIYRYAQDPGFQNQQQSSEEVLEIYYFARMIYEGAYQQEDVYLREQESGLVCTGAAEGQPLLLERAAPGKRSFS